MYIWSHLCLLVSLSPFMFLLFLVWFSLISSALSAFFLCFSSFPFFVACPFFLAPPPPSWFSSSIFSSRSQPLAPTLPFRFLFPSFVSCSSSCFRTWRCLFHWVEPVFPWGSLRVLEKIWTADCGQTCLMKKAVRLKVVKSKCICHANLKIMETENLNCWNWSLVAKDIRH